jgi:hypothetical protein
MGPIARFSRAVVRCRVVAQWAVAPAYRHGRRLLRLRAGGGYALNCLRYDVSGTHLRRRSSRSPPKLRPTLKCIALISVRTFIPIRVSPAKAAISSDRAIAENVTGAWLLCQERSASHRPARSNYTFLTTDVSAPRLPRLTADARPQPSARNVRFGSSTAVSSLRGLVRFPPQSRPGLLVDNRQLRAMCAHSTAYSITSSARCWSCSDTSRPSAFAALRLITSSYLVGA